MKTLVKSLITFVFLCGLALPNLAQTRQTQAILNAWDSEVTTDIFADTITSDVQYSDTVDIRRWAGSPRRFYLFIELDSVEGMTDAVSFSGIPEFALENAGPFFLPKGILGQFPPMASTFTQTGDYIFEVTPYGGDYVRFAFSCSDTLYLHAALWMKH